MVWSTNMNLSQVIESVIQKSKFMFSKFEKHKIVCMEIGMLWEAFQDLGLFTLDHQPESCFPMCSCERLH